MHQQGLSHSIGDNSTIAERKQRMSYREIARRSSAGWVDRKIIIQRLKNALTVYLWTNKLRILSPVIALPRSHVCRDTILIYTPLPRFIFVVLPNKRASIVMWTQVDLVN